MRRFMAGVVALFLAATPAFSQSGSSVRQSGSSVTPNSVPYWVTNGVIGDSASSTDSPISSIGATGPICSLSARQASGGWQSVCLQANTSSPGTISIQNYGSASAQNLRFIINGTPVDIPTGSATIITGSGTFTPGDVPCFLTSGGRERAAGR